MNAKLIVGLVLAGLLILFVVQNTAVVTIRFLLWDLSMSRALMIVLVLAVGLALGWLLGSQLRRRGGKR